MSTPIKVILICISFLYVNSLTAKKDCEVKFISYNILYDCAPGDTGAFDWKFRKEASINMIREEQPTVIGFQEPRAIQTQYLIENLTDYGYVYAQMEKGGFPNVNTVLIMYKKKVCKLLDWGYFWLNETPTRALKGWDAHHLRLASWVKLKDKKTKTIFYYFNTHLDHKGQKARIKGAELLVKKMKEIAGNDAHVVISGDMNSNPKTAFDINKDGNPIRVHQAFERWMKSGRETAYCTDKHYTFNGLSEARKHYWLDHFFYRNAEAIRFQTLVKNYGAPYISDHYPIALTLKFNNL